MSMKGCLGSFGGWAYQKGNLHLTVLAFPLICRSWKWYVRPIITQRANQKKASAVWEARMGELYFCKATRSLMLKVPFPLRPLSSPAISILALPTRDLVARGNGD